MPAKLGREVRPQRFANLSDVSPFLAANNLIDSGFAHAEQCSEVALRGSSSSVNGADVNNLLNGKFCSAIGLSLRFFWVNTHVVFFATRMVATPLTFSVAYVVCLRSYE